jgi:N-methylhydantoinase A
VTDADLLLGYLDPDYLLGGELSLDRDEAEHAVVGQIAGPLDVTLVQAAWGIHDLINETMAAAAKTHIAEKGGNPKVVTLVAFGGAGPVHAYGLAKKLGAPRLLVPPNAGVGSALGFFAAPRAFDVVRSHKVAVVDADFEAIEALFRAMEDEGREHLLRGSGDDVTDEVRFERSVDARFVGQGSETNVPIAEADFTALDPREVRRRFDAVYERLYGRTYPDAALEMVNFRVRASLPHRVLDLPELPRPEGASLDSALKGERLAFSGNQRDFVSHQVYDRYRLFPGASFTGPAIIEERESTVVVGEDARVSVDAYGFLWIDLPGARRTEDIHGRL